MPRSYGATSSAIFFGACPCFGKCPTLILYNDSIISITANIYIYIYIYIETWLPVLPLEEVSYIKNNNNNNNNSNNNKICLSIYLSMCSFVYLLLLHIYSVCAYVASEPRFLGFRVDRASFPDSFFRGG